MRKFVVIGFLGCSIGGCGTLGKGLPTWETAFAKSSVKSSKNPEAASDPQSLDIPVAKPTAQNPLTLGAAVSRTRVAPGEQVLLVVRCQTAKPWYIYAADGPAGVGVPTQLNLALPPGMTQPHPWQLPTATVKASPLGEISTYSDDFRFTIPLQISPTAPAGKMELQCEVAYQACSDSTCLAPGSQRLVIPLTVQPQ